MATPKSNRPHGNLVDITGRQFGQLTVLRHIKRTPGRKSTWECRCSCGNIIEVFTSNLIRGLSRRCVKCRKKRNHERTFKHGMLKTAEYKAWAHMLERCLNPHSAEWHNYGGRGITVCEEWIHNFVAFYNHIGPRPDPAMSLDRINNEGHYEPGNVRWATIIQQNRNQRRTVTITHDGETLTIREWAERLGINENTLRGRYYGNSAVPLFYPRQRSRYWH